MKKRQKPERQQQESRLMKNGDPHLAAVIHQPDESPEYQIYDNSGQKIRRNASKIIRQKITSFPFFQYNMNMEKSGCYFDKNFFNFLRIL